jgi:hypothetical protein
MVDEEEVEEELANNGRKAHRGIFEAEKKYNYANEYDDEDDYGEEDYDDEEDEPNDYRHENAFNQQNAFGMNVYSKRSAKKSRKVTAYGWGHSQAAYQQPHHN